jgi:hypothetical protein
VNGRCGGNGTCSYDQCFRDSDCGPNGVCKCRFDLLFPGTGPNVCATKTCSSDAECGDAGPCTPSPPGCDGGAPASYCHTLGDTCASDTDCGTDRCRYDLLDKEWRCSSCP